LGPESEELDEEPSAMQFSNAVCAQLLMPILPGNHMTRYVQIRSKGVVEQPKKLKARKATDPPPVHNGLGHELTKEPEQNQTTIV
jgi:hypothetical protein